jgi:hypothetical protein
MAQPAVVVALALTALLPARSVSTEAHSGAIRCSSSEFRSALNVENDTHHETGSRNAVRGYCSLRSIENALAIQHDPAVFLLIVDS